MSDRTPQPSDWAEWEALLVQYASGALDDEARRRVQDALATSPRLRAELADIERTRDAVRSPARPDADDGAELDAIFARLDDLGPPVVPDTAATEPSATVSDLGRARDARDRARQRARRLLAVAAALVLVGGAIGVVTVLLDGPDGDRPEVAGPPSGEEPIVLLQAASTAARAQGSVALDFSGRFVLTFDGTAYGEPGTVEVAADVVGEAEAELTPAGDGDYHIGLRTSTITGPEPYRPDPITQETLRVDGVRYTSASGEPFEPDPSTADASFFERLALTPDVLAELPELADGAVEDLGTEVLDGVEVRRLRLTFASDEYRLDEVDAPVTGDVLVREDDGLIHRLEIRASGPDTSLPVDDARWDVEFVYEVDRYGADVDVTAPR